MPRPLYRCLGPAGARAGVLTGVLTGAWARAAAAPAAAWTPETQVVIARQGARIAPPDLYRQIDRHWKSLDDGALAPFEDGDPARHFKDPGGNGALDRVIDEEVARAIHAIQAPLPFEQIVYQLGVVAHYVADASNPLNASDADPEEGRYFADYARYLAQAEPRLPVLFYGLDPALDASPGPDPLVAAALGRSRALYPLVGREYRRIGFASGVGRFDDRSTAFGVAGLAFSHALTDVGLIFRFIWIRAGGADFRSDLPVAGQRMLRLPRVR
jgi:hypothetical protein